MAIAVFLFARNKNCDRWHAGFMLTLSLVQLTEGMLWYVGLDSKANGMLTSALIVIVALQPVVQCGLSYIYLRNALLAAIAGLAAINLVIVAATLSSRPMKTVRGPNGHLVWRKPSVFDSIYISCVYFVGLFAPLVLNVVTQTKCDTNALLAVGVLTLAWSFYKGLGSGEWTSLWCLSTVLYGLVAIIAT